MTPEEAERIERARADVRALLQQEQFYLRHDGRDIDFLFMSGRFRFGNQDHLEDMANLAAVDIRAFEFCRLEMQNMYNADLEWPDPFKRLALRFMHGDIHPKKRPRGGDRESNAKRDIVIVKAMEAAIAHQLPEYARGESKEGYVTAAELVAECLAEGERLAEGEPKRPDRGPYVVLNKNAESEKGEVITQAIPLSPSAVIKIWQKWKKKRMN